MINRASNIYDDEENFKFAALAIKAITIILAIIILGISRYAFVFFSAAMLPTIISIFIDRGKHKCASATICSFNLIGALPYLMQIWTSISVNSAAKIIIADVKTWMVVYGAAVIGQLVYISLPALIAKIYIAKINVQISSLVKEKEAIANQWGINIKEEELS